MERLEVFLAILLPVVFIVAFTVLILSLALDAWVLDRLIKFEYENYRDRWVADGQPSGTFWIAPECWRFSGLLVNARSEQARQRVSCAWRKEVPAWAQGNEVSASLMWRHWVLSVMKTGSVAAIVVEAAQAIFF